MTFLDTRTIILSFLTADIVCLVVIVLLWLQNRKRFAGALFWVFDFSFQITALFLLILRGRIPDWMSYVLASTLIITGALLGYMGLERFVGKIRSQVHNYVLLIVFALVHAYFTFVQPDPAARNLNVSTGLLIICFQCAWLLLRSVKPGMRPLTRGVGTVFGLYSILNVVRIVEYFVGTQGRTDYLQGGIFDQFALIANQMLFILLTYSLVLMFNKRLLSEITSQEEKYSKVFHSTAHGIILTRLPEGRIIEANEGLLSITGHQYEDVRGKTTVDLGLWDRNEDRDAAIDELMQKGHIRQREFQFRKKSGERFTGLLSAEIITIEGEKHILGNINDITERRQTEDSLRKNEAFTRAVMDNLPIGIAVNSVDPAITFSYMNDNFPGYYRTTREALANPDSFWEAVYEDHRFREEIKKRVLDDCSSGDPALMFWKDVPLSRQGERTTFITARNIPVPHERLMISIVQDVTEQKDAEEEINRLNAKLEQKIVDRTRALRDNELALLNVVDDLAESSRHLQAANQALDAVNKELAAFSYSVSHDLRAPLRSVDGFSQALLEDCGDSLDDNGKRYLERIRNATQNMGRLIDDMLNLSRVTQSEFHQEPVDLSEMVRTIAEEHRQHKPLNGLTINIQEDVIVRGDRRLIHIAMTNLLDNAWKFSGKRERPCIGFGVVVREGKKIIFVNDNGVGFDMNYAGKLFGAFQRLHRFDEFPGTGIGLATVLRVINRHGGRIWVESEVDKGATFFFTLPE